MWSRSQCDGLGAAARCGAGRGARTNQVLQLAAGGVAVFGAAVVARSPGDRGEGDVQVAQEVGERGGLPGVGARSACTCGPLRRPSRCRWPVVPRRRDPRVLAAGAAVRDRGAVGPEEGEAPAGAGMHGGGLQQAAGVVGVGQAPAAGLAGGGRPAEDGAGRDGEVDQRRERRGRPGRGPGAVLVVVVLGGAAALVLPLGHVGAAVPAGISSSSPSPASAAVAAACRSPPPPAPALHQARCRAAWLWSRRSPLRRELRPRQPRGCPGLRAGPDRPARPGRRAGSGEPVERVAALGQVAEGQHAQLLQGAGQPAPAQRDGERVDVRLGRQRVLDRQLPAGQERVAGFLPPGVPLAAVRGGPCSLPRWNACRVEFHRHRGGLAGQLVIPQPRREGGEHLIGAGGVGVGQVPGGPPDQPGPVRIDDPGGRARPTCGAAGSAGRRPGPSCRGRRSVR